MADEANRWEGVYRNKEEAETSWFEALPQLSLDLIAETGVNKEAAIVDVGAGASRLVDCLHNQGFCRITVLDLSKTALAKARARLPQNAPVKWSSRTSCTGTHPVVSMFGMIVPLSIS
jgi:2-polyprenyl-3-methyl-5-hydroxy-6-metoxy-1,4-benzoquinol methylase